MTANPQIDFPWIKENSLEIETPFENDFWNRKALADRLTDYVSRLKVGATIAIDAEWGAGKSWFVKNWQRQLELQEFKVIYLNAFNQDYIDDPFLTISMEIANCIKTDQDSFDSIKETIGNAYRAILPNLPMMLWYLTTSLVGMGAIAKPLADAVTALQDTNEFGEKAADLLNEKLQEHLSVQIENYETEKQSLDYFKTKLTEITGKLDKPLVFIVDELDRCKPEFAIRLIERIKHFFDIPNVVFVLAVNKKQLEESINSFYGFKTAYNYLEKFIDFTIKLKINENSGSNYENILIKFNNDLQLKIQGVNINNYIKLCTLLSPNPRELVRVLNKFSLLKSEFGEIKTFFLFLILIYDELKLVPEFNELNLNDHFYNTHREYYKDRIDFYIDRNNDIWETEKYGEIVCNYINKNIYSDGYKPLEFFLNIISNHRLNLSANKNINKTLRDRLHPKIPSVNTYDIIKVWHNYIHMIDD